MAKRPLSVTIIGWLFIAAGIFGFAYHASELRVQHLFDLELIWVLFVRLLAIAGGIFVLRGANWARWLLLGWISYHVVLSAFHSPTELIIHSVLCALIAYVFFRRPATAYFRRVG